MARSIMIQGTGSNVGKSMIVAGLCRAFTRRGHTVRPFKPQNMSNNAAVTPQGGEIGRAQALQALAAGVPAHTDMNPVLLKPQSTTGAQVIVQGKVAGSMEARAFLSDKPSLLAPVLQSFQRLAAQADLVVVEGAGSPAETNLRAGDIANMGFALAASVPVILMGDIDRGGVIAQIIGTQAVLDPADAAQIKGFAINKFRGDVSLFDDGLADIVQRSDWPSLGVVPWFDAAHALPAEDVMDIASHGTGPCKIVVPRLPRISNFDDLDPLAQEPDVTVQIIEPGTALPGDATLVLLPGSKATIADLRAFRDQGWDIDLHAHVRRGGQVLGICGGYQMLGQTLSDPNGVEGPSETVPGLGLLAVDTQIGTAKQLALRSATSIPQNIPLAGYEMHMGKTDGPDCARPWLQINGQPHGASSENGLIKGCYLHGIFAENAFRASFLQGLGSRSEVDYGTTVEATLDTLADHLETHMDLDLLYALASEPRL